MAVLGVDGWRGAWVGARLDGRTVELLALPDVDGALVGGASLDPADFTAIVEAAVT